MDGRSVPREEVEVSVLSERIRFVVPGEPCAKGRPRFTRTGRTYTPEKTVNYENLVRLEYQSQCRDAEFWEKGVPLGSKVEAYFQIPSSISKKNKVLMLLHKIFPTKKPDVDNISKICLDALNGIAYYDDAQIVDHRISKRYAEKPYVVIEIWEHEED